MGVAAPGREQRLADVMPAIGMQDCRDLPHHSFVEGLAIGSKLCQGCAQLPKGSRRPVQPHSSSKAVYEGGEVLFLLDVDGAAHRHADLAEKVVSPHSPQHLIGKRYANAYLRRRDGHVAVNDGLSRHVHALSQAEGRDPRQLGRVVGVVQAISSTLYFEGRFNSQDIVLQRHAGRADDLFL